MLRRCLSIAIFAFAKFTPRVADIFDLIDQDVGRRISTFNHRIRYESLVDDAQQILEGGPAVEIEVYDSENCCYFLRMLPYLVESSIEGIVMSMVDISALDRARNRNKHLSAMVDTSHDAVISYDLKGEITSWNTGSERLYHYSADEAIDESIELILPESRKNEVQELINGLLRGEHFSGIETQRQTKLGETVDISLTASPVLDADGNMVGVSAIDRDISRFKRMQREKEDRDRQVHLLLDATAEAIIGTDMAGNCTFCNRSSVTMLGYQSSSDLLGKNMHALIHHKLPDGSPYRHDECQILAVLSSGEPIHNDNELLWRADGSSFHAELWTHPILRDGKAVGAVSTFLDITDRKAAEQAIRRSEMRFRDTFDNAAVGVAHVDLEGQWLRVNNRLCEITGYEPDEFYATSFQDITHPDDLEEDLDNVE